MQRTLIVLVVGLLAVGCVGLEQKQKALRDSVVGEYELKHKDGITYKHIYLENGVAEWYKNGKKQPDNKWAIVNGELHVNYGSRRIGVRRIYADKSITYIADIFDGKRKDYPKDSQSTYKKIK